MNKHWRELIVKERLSPDLLEELTGKIDGMALQELRSIICKSKTDLSRFRRLVGSLRKRLPQESYEALKAELQEIQEDSRWIATRRGAYVLKINSWVEPFFKEFRGHLEFSDVIIGGHAEREVVFVTGVVPTSTDFASLMEYIRSKNPPFKLLTDVHIGKWTGPKAEVV